MAKLLTSTKYKHKSVKLFLFENYILLRKFKKYLNTIFHKYQYQKPNTSIHIPPKATHFLKVKYKRNLSNIQKICFFKRFYCKI